MSKVRSRIDDALGIDVDKIISDADEEVNKLDDAQIQKYNERKQEIEKLRSELKVIREMDNKKWSEALLKNSADKIVETQHIFAQEIQDDPISRNITALGELSNALVHTIKAVRDIELDDRKLALSQEKNDMRRQEIELASGKTLDAPKGFIGNAKNSDILKMIENDVDPLEGEEENDA